MGKKFNIIVLLLAVLVLVGTSSIYTVDQTQQAIVLQFGQPKGDVKKAGLHFKIPYIQKVIYFDSRLLEYDVQTTEIYTGDKKNMVMDAYACWRITDPLKFYQSFRGDNAYTMIEGAKKRLGDVIIGELRRELGLHTMMDIISQNRGSIMESVTKLSNKKLSIDVMTGLEIVDVRIKRADLPLENQKAVYERMQTERKQQATKYRSEGELDAQRIRAAADQERREIIAEAVKKSKEIIGNADADAARIYAEAYNQDPEFYYFMRSLESYQKSFKDSSTFIFTPEDTEYLKFFNKQ